MNNETNSIHPDLVREEGETYPHFYARTYHTRMMEKFQHLAAQQGFAFVPDNEENIISAFAHVIQSYADNEVRKQSQSLPAVEQPEKSTSAKDFELIAFAHYVQDCIRFKGELTYPEHKALVQAWKGTYKSQQPSQPKGKTLEEVKALSVKRYGNDINSFGQQRDGFVEGYTQAMQEYANQPRKEWISVEDGLPSDNQPILFITKKQKKHLETRKGSFFLKDPFGRDNMFYGDMGHFAKENIAYWMPLPTHPQK